MALPTDLNIESLTFTHADLRKNYFYLDRLLDRMAPIFSLNDPAPHVRELGSLIVFPAELLVDIFESLSLVDRCGFGAAADTRAILSTRFHRSLAARPSFRPLLATLTNVTNKFKMVERHTMYDCPTGVLNKKLGWSPWYDSKTWIESDLYVSALLRKQRCREFDMYKQDTKKGAVIVSRDPCHFRLLLHMASVIAPWPDSTGSIAEEGVFCSTCLNIEGDRLYTKSGFVEHLKDCRVVPDQACIYHWRKHPLRLCEDE
ncbi:hypothetical protein EJ04DRAFT_557815 [Polyplosphaeria fusca]|uniref:F-box domain-containing protein n=1 Tax=Polyplosphaeria fusca TaxID=682080 RepID=A0A9P4UW22_9PLEO|nr:hypothetical protein EJ04DRAFT_557815 [Polyplosphaeria fusca]